MVETAIVLPLVLLGIFFFIWLGTVMHAKSSLDAAVTRAVRLACTRGVKEVAGLEIIERIQNWQGGAALSTVEMLLKNGDIPNWMDWYTATSTQFNFVSGLDGLPSEYIYALVYVNEAMKKSIGSSIRYPCDPEDLSSGSGCLGCVFLNPDDLTSLYDSPGPWGIDAPRRKIGIECRFQPAHAFLKPLVSLIGFLTGGLADPLIVLKKKAIVDVPSI